MQNVWGPGFRYLGHSGLGIWFICGSFMTDLGYLILFWRSGSSVAGSGMSHLSFWEPGFRDLGRSRCGSSVILYLLVGFGFRDLG